MVRGRRAASNQDWATAVSCQAMYEDHADAPAGACYKRSALCRIAHAPLLVFLRESSLRPNQGQLECHRTRTARL